MALSEAFVERHLAYWSAELDSGFRAYRKHWPHCLFHHAPLENALGILRDGNIRARNDPGRPLLRDVAAPGVIDNRQEAHDRVRLYFRPRTPTQFHIEGIRKETECQYGADTHAPILLMFVLDAKSILTLPDVQFSDRNMQRLDVRQGTDEAFFNSIPFGQVYHDGGIDGDYSIIAHRCAEVLPSTPLPLDGVLRGIWLRSEPERDTLLHQLAGERGKWEKYCRVSEELKVFDKRFAFVNELSLSREGVSFRINYRHDLQPVDLRIRAVDAGGKLCIDFHNEKFTTYNTTGGRWIYRVALDPSTYLVQAHIEGHLAYECQVTLEDSLV